MLYPMPGHTGQRKVKSYVNLQFLDKISLFYKDELVFFKTPMPVDIRFSISLGHFPNATGKENYTAARHMQAGNYSKDARCCRYGF